MTQPFTVPVTPEASALIDRHQRGEMTDYPATARAYETYAETARLMDASDALAQNAAVRTGQDHAAHTRAQAEELKTNVRDALIFIAPHVVERHETLTSQQLIERARPRIEGPRMQQLLTALEKYPATITRLPSGAFRVTSPVRLS